MMMCRVKFTTTLDEDLLFLAKNKASLEGLEGANAVIEKALRVYFRNCRVTVWEKQLNNGTLQKLIIRSSQLIIETLQKRSVLKKFDRTTVSDKSLKSKGFHKVWFMPNTSTKGLAKGLTKT